MFKILSLSNKKEKLLFTFSILLVVLAAFAEISQPLFFILIGEELGKISPGSVDNKIIANTIALSAGMLLTVLFGMFATLVAIQLVSRASTSLSARVRMLLFNKILNLSTNKIDEHGVSSLVVRTSGDLTQIRDAIYFTFTLVIRAPLFIIIGFVLSMVVLGGLTVQLESLEGEQYLLALSFIIIPILIPVISILILFGKKYFSEQRTLLDKNNQIMLENIVGIRIIRAFRIQNNQETRFSVVNSGLMRVSKKGEIILHSIIPIITLALNLAIMVIQIIFGLLASNMNSNPDAIISLQLVVQAFMQFFSLILVGLVLFGSSVFIIQKAKPSFRRVNEILDEKSSIVDGKSNKKIIHPSIEFKNVFFRYAENKKKNSLDTISNVSFKVNPGETLGIIGSTGSGKSTIMNLVARFYDVTSGEVLIDGTNVKDYKLKELTSAMSIAFQDKILFKGTMKSNILVGNENASNEEIIKASKNAEAFEFINERKNKFNALVEENGANLSGGQKQRLSIARALVKNPKILIFDDSLSALDNITETKLLRNIKSNLKDTTLLIVAQRIKSIQNANKIILLDDGKISAIGNHDELMKNSALYQQIYDSQNTTIGG